MFMCCVRNPWSINICVRVPGREVTGWPRNCWCAKCLCAFSGPWSSSLKCLILMVALVVRNPTMIMVIVLCGQLLSVRALQLLLSFEDFQDFRDHFANRPRSKGAFRSHLWETNNNTSKTELKNISANYFLQFLERCNRHTHKGHREKDWKSWISGYVQGVFRLFSGHFQAVSGYFQGIFRVFSGCFSLCPFRVCPLDRSQIWGRTITEINSKRGNWQFNTVCLPAPSAWERQSHRLMGWDLMGINLVVLDQLVSYWGTLGENSFGNGIWITWGLGVLQQRLPIITLVLVQDLYTPSASFCPTGVVAWVCCGPEGPFLGTRARALRYHSDFRITLPHFIVQELIT